MGLSKVNMQQLYSLALERQPVSEKENSELKPAVNP